MPQYNRDLYQLFLDVCYTRNHEKKMANIVFKLEEKIYLPENFVFNDLLSVINKFYNFKDNCEKTLWSLRNWSWRFFILYITGKDTPKSYLLWKVSLFLRKIVFSTTY